MVLGPKVVTRALGYTITKEELGGPSVHCDSGVVDNIVATEEDAFQQVRGGGQDDCLGEGDFAPPVLEPVEHLDEVARGLPDQEGLPASRSSSQRHQVINILSSREASQEPLQSREQTIQKSLAMDVTKLHPAANEL